MLDLLRMVGLFLVGLGIGGEIVGRIERDHWRNVCIEHGIAEYDRVTGEWRLIEKPEGE